MNIAVSIADLCVTFAQQTILKQVSIDFTAKQITTLVGPSGSGKTTLLRSINRLNEEYTHCQTQGQVKIQLEQKYLDIYSTHYKLDLSILRQKVGMLFQTPQVLPVSIYKNIAMPLMLLTKIAKKEISTTIKDVLCKVGLWEEVKDRLDLPAHHLSGGQQQRLCLARTLALKPSILLLDEPTSSLDIYATKTIENLLDQLRNDYTIIMVSHSLDQACRLADQVVVLQNGLVSATLQKPINSLELNTMLSL